jgi:hypothetical protein
MTAYIIRRDSKLEIKLWNYTVAHGVDGVFSVENFDINVGLYDILVVNGSSAKLIEGCHNLSCDGTTYHFKGVRVKDL